MKKLPIHYWFTTYTMIRQQVIAQWKDSFEPQAELIGQLTHPEIFKEYRKMKDKIEKQKEEGKPINVSISTNKGISSYAETDTHYDPNKGLVDKNGRIIIPKEKYDKVMRLDGIAISF